MTLLLVLTGYPQYSGRIDYTEMYNQISRIERERQDDDLITIMLGWMI